MKKLVVMFAAVVSLVVGTIAQEVPSAMLLDVNQRKTIEFAEDVKKAESDSKCVTLDGIGEKSLIIIAHETGVAKISYTLRNGTSGTIAVTCGQYDKTLSSIQDYLERQLKDVIGINIVVNKDLQAVELSGKIKLVNDRDLFNSVVEKAKSMWANKILNNVVVSIDTEAIEKGFTKKLEELGIDKPGVSFDNKLSMASITGTAYTQDVKDNAKGEIEKLANRLKLGAVEISNNIKISDALFEVEFQYFQFTDTLKSELGADLLNNIGLQTSGSATWGSGVKPSYSANVNIDIGKVLNMLAEDGFMAISKKQTISAQNGKTGESQYGGDFVLRPEATVGGGNATVEHIQFGFLLKATPRFVSATDVNLDLEAEVSSISGVTKDKDVQKDLSKIKQTIRIPLNTGVILSVSQSDNAGEGSGGTPILRKIPIINWVFGKKSTVASKTYSGFLVIPRVTGTRPTVAPAVSEKTEEIMKQVEAKLKK